MKQGRISMKKIKTLVFITFLFFIVTVGMTILDYLSLHDIRYDYVSERVLEELGVEVSSPLPDWTSTPGEWLMVNISFIVRILFLICVALTFYHLSRYGYKE
jgi:hypothetical protein